MIEWNKGEPPRDGEDYLVIIDGGYIDVLRFADDAWENSSGAIIADDDFEPLYWSEINMPDGYREEK